MSVFTILYRNIKWRFHNSFTIVVTILQPILWLVLHSAVASQTMQGTGISNYYRFYFARPYCVSEFFRLQQRRNNELYDES